MPINTGSFAALLWPGLNKIYGDQYNEYPAEYKQIFTIEKSSKGFEEDMGVTGFGQFAVKTQGGGVSYDTAQQGFLTRYNHVVYALGFVITEEMKDDDQYGVTGARLTKGLAYSGRNTLETVHANILNRAFSGSYVGGDGLEMCSAAHLNVSGGTWSNELATAADFSESALEQACIDIAKFTDDRGKKMAARPRSLIIPVELEFDAQRVLKSVLQSGSANNDINAVRSLAKIPDGIIVNHYLTDADAWFVKTDVPNGLKSYERRAMRFKSDNDFDTENAKFKADCRFSCGWTDPRGIFGSPGA